MRPIDHLAGAGLLALALLCGAAAPKPDVVGQIVEQTAGAVLVRHGGGKPVAARPYQPLYPGDIVSLASPKAHATVELADANGGLVVVTAANSPFRVSAARPKLDPAAFSRFVASWGFVLQPPPSHRWDSTTPRSLEPTTVLFPPGSEQRLRSKRRQQLPIVWTGPAAQVELRDEGGALLAHTTPVEAGFALLDSPPLDPGKYRLRIGEQAADVTIQVAAADGTPEPGGASAEEAALRATETFDGSVGDRLQALADLQSLSSHSFLAHAVMRAVRTGNYGPKVVAR